MTAGVYAIVNGFSGQAYIGSSKNIEVRLAGWQYALNKGKGHNKALQADWTANQGTVFDLHILEEIEANDTALKNAEQRWLDQYADRCYNVRKRIWRTTPGVELPYLHRIRTLKALSMRDLSRRTGVSIKAISDAERGGRIHGLTMFRLAKALDVDVLDLCSDSDEIRRTYGPRTKGRALNVEPAALVGDEQ